MNIENVIGDYKIFLDGVFRNLEKAGFSKDEFKELDHIAYRTESMESYEKIKNALVNFSESFSDSAFNGRPILVCKLKTPLVYNEFVISGIEVPAPKNGKPRKDGLEHAEFVIKTNLAEFREKHAEIDFNLEAYDREINPELEVNFENCAAKFHTQSLLDVRNI